MHEWSLGWLPDRNLLRKRNDRSHSLRYIRSRTMYSHCCQAQRSAVAKQWLQDSLSSSPGVCGNVGPVFQWATSICAAMLIDTVSWDAAIPGVDNGTRTKTPNTILCVNSTIEVWRSGSWSTQTIVPASRSHNSTVSMQQGKVRHVSASR
jgi:hypothetical protein